MKKVILLFDGTEIIMVLVLFFACLLKQNLIIPNLLWCDKCLGMTALDESFCSYLFEKRLTNPCVPV